MDKIIFDFLCDLEKNTFAFLIKINYKWLRGHAIAMYLQGLNFIGF